MKNLLRALASMGRVFQFSTPISDHSTVWRPEEFNGLQYISRIA